MGKYARNQPGRDAVESAIGNNLAPSTQDLYARRASDFIVWMVAHGHDPLSYNDDDVARYLAELGPAGENPTAASQLASGLRRLFDAVAV